MVKKVKIDFARRIAERFYVPLTSCHFVGNKEETLQVGSLSLAIKVKKRLRYIRGKIILIDYEAGGHGHPGYEVRQFVPNNATRFAELVK